MARAAIVRAGPSTDPDGEIMYSAGVVLDPESPEIIYLARKRADWFQVEVWRTPDGGATWRTKQVTHSARDHMRPVAPRNRPSTHVLQILFMYGRYPGYRTYETSLALTNRAAP